MFWGFDKLLQVQNKVKVPVNPSGMAEFHCRVICFPAALCMPMEGRGQLPQAGPWGGEGYAADKSFLQQGHLEWTALKK